MTLDPQWSQTAGVWEIVQFCPEMPNQCFSVVPYAARVVDNQGPIPVLKVDYTKIGRLDSLNPESST